MALAYLFQGGRGAVIGKGAFIRINTVHAFKSTSIET